MTQNPFPAEPSDTDASDTNSIAGVTARLLRWGRIAPSGLARVEYASARARDAVMENLRREFGVQYIPFVEIELTPDTPAEQHVLRLRETLGKLPPGVVSIMGLNRAFPADVPLLDSLGTLNFNRDTLVHFDLRQIWWMQGEMATTFRLYNPDFDRFFLVRLHLAEIPAIFETPRIPNALPEGDLLTYQEAQQLALYNMERFYKALRARREISELVNLCVGVFKPLVQSGHIVEAGERQEQLFAEIEHAGYDLNSYLKADPDLARTQLLDADNLNELGALRWQQGRYAEAQALIERELAIKRYFLPQDHPDIAGSLNNLATLYEAQGRYMEADPLYMQTLDIHRHTYGEAHAHVATSLNNLAGLYTSQGRYVEAEPLYMQALEIKRQNLGKGHPEIAGSLNDLATLYDSQGRYAEAEPLYIQALAICRQALGENHPGYATELNNLAGLYRLHGRYEEAEPLYIQALAISRHAYGEAHPHVATSLNNLATLYESQGHYDKAEPLYMQALAIRRKELPQDHPDIANSLNNLAGLYDSQGRYHEAEPLYVEALQILERALGSEHPNTRVVHKNLEILRQQRLK